MGFDVAMWLGRINARRLSVVGQPNGTDGMHSGIYELDCVEGVNLATNMLNRSESTQKYMYAHNLCSLLVCFCASNGTDAMIS